jgi:hypothetical protein
MQQKQKNPSLCPSLGHWTHSWQRFTKGFSSNHQESGAVCANCTGDKQLLHHKTSLFFKIKVFLQKHGHPSRARSLLSRPASWNELSFYNVDFCSDCKVHFLLLSIQIDKDSSEFVLLAMHKSNEWFRFITTRLSWSTSVTSPSLQIENWVFIYFRRWQASHFYGTHIWHRCSKDFVANRQARRKRIWQPLPNAAPRKQDSDCVALVLGIFLAAMAWLGRHSDPAITASLHPTGNHDDSAAVDFYTIKAYVRHMSGICLVEFFWKHMPCICQWQPVI